MFLLLGFLLTLATTVFAAQSDVGAQLATRGLLLTALSVFGAGVMVSLTPCVYPMVPITLSIIGARSAGHHPLTGFLRSLVFVLGIAVIYSALGLLVARTDRTFGFLFQNKWVVLGIAAFFAAMGVSMLGAFEIQMPAVFAGRLQSGANRGGFIGAFMLGLVTGVVASPCGSPVLFGVLVIAAQSGRAGVGVLLLFAYALGIGLLFLVLGTFPSLLKSVPKSGVWMEDIKRLLGVVLIGVAVYYLAIVIPAIVYWPLVVLLCLIAAGIIAIKSVERRGQPGLLRAWRIVGLLCVLAATYFAATKVPAAIGDFREARMARTGGDIAEATLGAGSHNMALTAPSDADTTGLAATQAAATGELTWLENEPAAIALVKETGKPMMVDFTAAWCAACKELDRKTFPVPEVRAELANFVLVKIDCTEETQENTGLQKKYGSKSLPTVAFVTKDGKLLSDLTLYTFEKPEDFLKRLAKVPR